MKCRFCFAESAIEKGHPWFQTLAGIPLESVQFTFPAELKLRRSWADKSVDYRSFGSRISVVLSFRVFNLLNLFFNDSFGNIRGDFTGNSLYRVNDFICNSGNFTLYCIFKNFFNFLFNVAAN